MFVFIKEYKEEYHEFNKILSVIKNEKFKHINLMFFYYLKANIIEKERGFDSSNQFIQ